MTAICWDITVICPLVNSYTVRQWRQSMRGNLQWQRLRVPHRIKFLLTR